MLSFVLLLGLRASGLPLEHALEHASEALSAPSVARALAEQQASHPARDAAATPLLHSHNDYERARPLDDALAAGMDSIEADLWLGSRGTILVSHTGWFVRGTLEDLYLRPLLARSRPRPLYLWLDLKQDDPDLIIALEKLLTQYETLLTRFRPLNEGGTIERQGAVTAILTGSAVNGRRYLEKGTLRLASRDLADISADDPRGVPAWEWNTLRWSSAFRWTGLGKMPEEERQKLRTLVDTVHSRGRKLRIYAAPETEAYWREAARAGVDMIGTDSVTRLGRLGETWRR